jgi:sugar lactone lactonase YvrE
MSSPADAPRLHAAEPSHACPGGVVTLKGAFLTSAGLPPPVRLGIQPIRPMLASSSRIIFRVPKDADAGRVSVQVGAGEGASIVLDVARVLTTGVHQVDNPVFDRNGRLYATYSGSRGQQVPVSIFRVSPSGAREALSSAIVNPTSMAIGPDQKLYVSSRFEGTVYRVEEDGSALPAVTDVGVACGLAFDREGALYVGDRSGTIFKVPPGGHPAVLASLPPSIAAFHLAIGPDECVYVTGPTLTTYDHVYRVFPDGTHEVAASGFGRPQGLAFDEEGRLFVVDALAGASGLHRVLRDGTRALVASGEGLVGLAFDPGAGFVLASNDTIYQFARRPAVLA